MSRMSFYSFFDTESIKRTILSLRGNREVKTPINNVLEYSFYCVLNIKTYYDYTGDFDFVKRNYEYMKLLIILKELIGKGLFRKSTVLGL